MVTAPRQLFAALLLRGTELRVAFLLVAGAAQPPVGVRVGKVGQTVVAHALRELAHLLHRSWVGFLMFATWGQVAALLLRGTEPRITFLLVAGAAQPPVGVRVGKVGHTVVAHALRERPARLRLVDRGDPVSVVLPARGQDQQRRQQQRRRQTSRQPLSCHAYL